MKYTTEEALAEIMRRSEQIMIRRDRRACRRLSGAAGALLAALVLVIAVMPGGGAAAPTESVYGAFLLSREAGGLCVGGGARLRPGGSGDAAVSETKTK